MSIVSDAIALNKLGKTMEIPFPEEDPEITFIFERQAVGEESFANIEVFSDPRVLEAPKETQNSVAGKVLVEKYMNILRNKLVGWKEEMLAFNKDNARAILDSLDFVQASELVNLYISTNKKQREAALGNGTKLVKGSSKQPSKG